MSCAGVRIHESPRHMMRRLFPMAFTLLAALGAGCHDVPPPTMAGTWAGFAPTFGIALGLTQSGDEVTGYAIYQPPESSTVVHVVGTFDGLALQIAMAFKADSMRYAGTMSRDRQRIRGTFWLDSMTIALDLQRVP